MYFVTTVHRVNLFNFLNIITSVCLLPLSSVYLSFLRVRRLTKGRFSHRDLKILQILTVYFVLQLNSKRLGNIVNCYYYYLFRRIMCQKRINEVQDFRCMDNTYCRFLTSAKPENGLHILMQHPWDLSSTMSLYVASASYSSISSCTRPSRK